MLSKSVEEMNKEETKMDMTPMIDVTFQLLIFFMCTLHFSTAEGILSSNLPKDEGIHNVSVSKPPSDPITVTVQENMLIVGDTQYPYNTHLSIFESDIEGQVQKVGSTTDKIPFDLKIAKDVPFHRLITAMNVAHKINKKNYHAKLTISIAN
jgi:biopolymer transport protein ExbD